MTLTKLQCVGDVETRLCLRPLPQRDRSHWWNRDPRVRIVNMTQWWWWWALLTLGYLSLYPGAAQHHRKALFPSAYRIKRGTYSLVNPTFQQSVEDVNLLFEILLAGMQIEDEHHTMLIPDEELASLRSVQKLDVICEDVLPKSLSDIRRLIAGLAQRGEQPLSRQDFERTVLTLVHSTQMLGHMSDQQKREVWMEAVMQLFRAIQKDLRPSGDESS